VAKRRGVVVPSLLADVRVDDGGPKAVAEERGDELERAATQLDDATLEVVG